MRREKLYGMFIPHCISDEQKKHRGTTLKDLAY